MKSKRIMMDWRRKSFGMMMLGILITAAKAQDPHFSQYFNSPITINPALTGKQITDWRALAVVRSQWWGGTEVAPFTTTAVSLEKSFITGKNGKNCKIQSH